jgi:hypothetical protein
MVPNPPQTRSRSMSELGQKRRFGDRLATSGLPRTKDIVRPPRHVSNVPKAGSRLTLFDHLVGNGVQQGRSTEDWK